MEDLWIKTVEGFTVLMLAALTVFQALNREWYAATVLLFCLVLFCIGIGERGLTKRAMTGWLNTINMLHPPKQAPLVPPTPPKVMPPAPAPIAPPMPPPNLANITLTSPTYGTTPGVGDAPPLPEQPTA